MNQYKQRSVVVTGAGRGIGRAICERLGTVGWTVVGVSRSGAPLEELAARIPRFVPVVGDVADDTVLATARRLAEDGARLTGWVNNAAINTRKRLDVVTRTEIDRMIAVDLTAPVVGCQEAVRSFLASGTPGSIVNISSIHGRFGFPGCSVYDACKGGLEALTRYVCTEYGSVGIRCNAVAPGAVATESADAYFEGFADPAEARREHEMLAPMGRSATAAEVAYVVEFLLSERSSAINGHTLATDLGTSARCYRYELEPDFVQLLAERAETSEVKVRPYRSERT
jgi:NAD(P)-dependent dehydrogenase (short-subunit alcohol dehydrogenase family)